MQPTGMVESPNMPPAQAPSDEERTMALVAHFGNIFTWGVAGIIVYLIKKDQSKWVAFHALQAALVGVILGWVGSMVCVGPIAMYIFSIIAGLKVMKGEYYEYPLIGQKVRESIYGK